MNFGYELFAKQHDRIHLACPDFVCGGGFATDCLGNCGELDFNVLECGTKAMTDKLSGEIFHRVAFWEVTAGASRVIAGSSSNARNRNSSCVRLYF